MTGIVWEDPPPGPIRVAARLAPLRERPWTWGRVLDGVSRTRADNFRRDVMRGNHVGVEPGEFEARAGRIEGAAEADSRSFAVWCRYVGAPQTIHQQETP